MICPWSEGHTCREPSSGHPDALLLKRWDGPQTLCTIPIFTHGQLGSNMLPIGRGEERGSPTFACAMKNETKYLKEQNAVKMSWAVILIRRVFPQDRPQGHFFSWLVPIKVPSWREWQASVFL